MGFLSNRLGVQALSLEDPAQPLLPPSALFESLGLGRSDAGVMINVTQAMRITTAQSCIKIISEDLASVGHEILQAMPDGSFQRATTHRLWPLLHDIPNPNLHMTAKVFWGCVLAGQLAWGNGYAWIKRDNAARVIELVPLASGRTAPVIVRGELHYATTQTLNGQAARIDPSDILHFKGLSFDGITGMSPIQTCKNAFGLAMAAEKFGAQLFGSGARASGVLSHPGTLETEAYENLKKSVREWATGENALRPVILEEGMTWQQYSINPDDAQFLETRRFQRSEIACLYRVAMHLLQDLMRATNNNIEHQSLDHVRYCLRPNGVGIEEEVNAKLLRAPFTMEHNLYDLQRGDFASQTQGFQILRNIGTYSTDDILRKLRENPIGEAAGGNIRTVQGAMINLTALLTAGSANDDDAAATSAPDDSQPFDRITPAYRNLFREAGARIERAGKKDASFAEKLVQPLVSSMAQALLALRYGNCELTSRETALIEAVTRVLVAGPVNENAATYACRELAKQLV